MNLKVKMKLNERIDLEAEFQGADLQDAVRAAGAFLDFDGKCGMCNGKEGIYNMSLTTRITKDKGYKFTEFQCVDCGAKRPMGKYQDGSGFFLKPWEPPYNPEQGG